MTQKQLAAKTGINVKLISAYENDHTEPRGPNWRLLVVALDGKADAVLAAPSCDPPSQCCSEILERPEAIADEQQWSALCREVTRRVGSREARILVGWREENGDLGAIVQTHDDKRLVTMRTRVTPTTLDDVRSVRAIADRLEAQIRLPAA
jgi:transcriptional regulator with XRE-family HTH domain